VLRLCACGEVCGGGQQLGGMFEVGACQCCRCSEGGWFAVELLLLCMMSSCCPLGVRMMFGLGLLCWAMHAACIVATGMTVPGNRGS
jgi:hypothetical protein